MSTFSGEISEIPGISVDRFTGVNLDSSAYFLSHCHSDHMEGLGEYFFRTLIIGDKYLYCSPISRAFLLGIYPEASEDRIVEIEQTVPKTIDYKTKNNGEVVRSWLTVSTCPAGHCPGSIMFIFNKEEKTILYTGDFRINPQDLPKLNTLNNKIDGINYPKRFDAVYLDTTFLSLDFRRFPSRKESCQEISRAIENWLKSDAKNVAIIECSAFYGPEYLFMEVSKLLKVKIHVKDKVYSNYTRIAELAECVTSDGWESRIHACNSKMSREELLCRTDVAKENIFTVVPSALRWRGKNMAKFTEYDVANRRRLYVCHSMHASYEELKAFVDYFKPDKIVPNVCPSESTNEIYELVKSLTSYRRKTGEVDKVCDNFKLSLPARSISDKKFISKYFNDDDEDEDDC